MAEGGHPDPTEETFEYPMWNWDRGTLEYVFASDFIHFVIETEDKGWRSNKLIVHRSPLTPFNTTIQKVVEELLKRDSTILKMVFRKCAEHCGKLNQARFNICAVFLKLTYFTKLPDYGTLLKYFCVLGLFSAWALGEGLHTAPFFAVDIILGYIREFLVENRFTNMDDFWYSFERDAGDALELPNICTLNEEELKCLPDMQKLVEGTFEETQGDVEGSSENLGEEPEMEILPKCTEGAESEEKVSSEKEEDKGDKEESPSKEAPGSHVETYTKQGAGSEARVTTGGDAAGSDVTAPAEDAAGSDERAPAEDVAGSDVTEKAEDTAGSEAQPPSEVSSAPQPPAEVSSAPQPPAEVSSEAQPPAQGSSGSTSLKTESHRVSNSPKTKKEDLKEKERKKSQREPPKGRNVLPKGERKVWNY